MLSKKILTKTSNKKDFAFILGDYKFTSVDISDPLNPIILDSITSPIVSSTSYDVVIDHDRDILFATTATTTSCIIAYDISDPENLSEISLSISLIGTPYTIAYNEETKVLFIADYIYTLIRAYDMSDLNNVSLIGSLNPEDNAIRSVVLDRLKTTLYVLTNSSAIFSVDVSNPSNMVVNYSYYHAVFFDNERTPFITDDNTKLLTASNDDTKLKVFSIESSSTITQLSGTSTSPYVTSLNSLSFDNDTDVCYIAGPTSIASYQLNTNGSVSFLDYTTYSGGTNIQKSLDVKNKNLYITDNDTTSLKIYDVSNPNSLTLLNSIVLPNKGIVCLKINK